MTRSASSQKDTNRLLLAAALQYAGRGWRVFPLVPQGKRPLTESGFKDATTEDTRIITWWERWPSANVGLATGGPFDVLDLDGDEGRENFKREVPGYVHRGPVVQTGRGYHLYFQSGAGRNSSNRIPKVDFRGDGGYVVAPPSVHETGTPYTWMEGRGPNLPLPPPPEWLGRIARPEGPPRLIKNPPTALGGPVELAVRWDLPVYWHNPPKTHCVFGTHNDSDPSLTLYDDHVFCFGCGRAATPQEFYECLRDNYGNR